MVAVYAAGANDQKGIIVNDITDIQKKGWEYLWVRYADEEDAGAKVVIKRPIGVYVERVYEYADFAGLGIGA